MNRLRMFASRVLGLVRRPDRALDAEIETHLALLAEEYERRGLSPADARHAARREFGGIDQMKERYRDQGSVPWIESLVQDIRYGTRLLRRSPGFTLAAVLSLALGIGANTAIFSAINLALLKDLPVRDPATLAVITGYRTPGPTGADVDVPADWLQSGHDVSYPIFRDLAARQRVFSDMFASGSLPLAQLAIDGVPADATDVNAAFVSANYFTVLGVAAAVGRTIAESDSRAAGEGAVAVIGDGLWDRRFGRDPSVVGRTLTLNGVPFTIIGVAARGFYGERLATRRDVWIPQLMQPVVMTSNMLERRTASWFRAFGRLAPGVTPAQAALELTQIYRQLKADEIAGRNGSLIENAQPDQFRIVVAAGTRGLSEDARGRVRQPLLLLFAATVIVLLIACCNVANLLIARAAVRQRELGIRLAIGSSRRRLIRQLLTESALLSTLGAAGALLLAYWSSTLLTRFVGLEGRELPLDGTVAAYVAGVAMLTSLLFGVLPAIQATAVRAAPAAVTSGMREVGAAPRRRLARGLVVVQVGLSLWLLIGAALLVRSLQNFSTLDIGVDRARLLTVTLQTLRPVAQPRAGELQGQLVTRLRQVPGVEAVAFARYGLFGGGALTAPVRVPDSAVNPATDGEVRENYISPGYFAALGIPVVRGRDFAEGDSAAAPRVTILNETMARHYFGDADPVGRVVYFPSVDAQGRYIPFHHGLDKAQAMEVIGVARDAKFDNLRDPVRRLAYLPIAQGRGGVPATVLVRTSAPAALAGSVRRALTEIDPNLSVRSVSTVQDQIKTTLAAPRTLATLLGVFGGVALLLACVGLYGVMAYGVARRTGEIGVRIALGATRAAVVAMVLREILVLTALGILIGIPAALGTTHLLQSQLFGLTPTDPVTVTSAVATMVVVASLAGWLPARRAARVDAVTALRCE